MDTDVLIAGAGPTGMMLALQLVRRGVACRVIDRAAGPWPTSRALVVQPRTLELLDAFGLADEIERRGIPQTGIQLRSGGRLLARMPHGRFPYPATCVPQSEVESVFREALARAGLRVEFGTELRSFEQNAEGLRAETTAGVITAAWLAGCDGSHSAVRHGLGVDFQGAAIPETNLMADVDAEWDLDGGDVRIFFHPEGVLVVLHQPEGVWRLIASVRDPGTAPTEDFFHDVLRRRAGIRPRAMHFRWTSTFHVHSRLAASYRDRRAFLAGDAAHVHSPVGGQGMNLGIHDAINLGWKLAHVIQGGPQSLLDTYELERRPVARHVVRATEPLTRIGIASSPVKRLVRDRVLPVVLGLPPVRRSITQQASGMALAYPDSSLTGPRGGGRPPFRRGFYSPAWELFRDRSGGVLVRPDGFVAARFETADMVVAERYLAERVGGAALVAEGRELPNDEVLMAEPALAV